MPFDPMIEDVALTRRLVADDTTLEVLAREAARRRLRSPRPWWLAASVIVAVAVVFLIRQDHGSDGTQRAVLIAFDVVLALVCASAVVFREVRGAYRHARAVYAPEVVPGSVTELGLGRTALRCREPFADYTRAYSTFTSATRHGGVVHLAAEQGGLVFDGRLLSDADLQTVRDGIAAVPSQPLGPTTLARRTPAGSAPLTASRLADPELAAGRTSALVRSRLADPLFGRAVATSLVSWLVIGWVLWPSHDAASHAAGTVVVAIVGTAVVQLWAIRGFVRVVHASWATVTPGSRISLGVGRGTLRFVTVAYEVVLHAMSLARIDVRDGFVVLRTTGQIYYAIPADLFTADQLATLRSGALPNY